MHAPSLGRSAPLVLGLLAALTLLCATGCQPYRIEYRTRPGFYSQASETDLPDEITLADGTVIKYIESAGVAPGLAPADGVRQSLREERTDGTIILRSYAPEHVLAHLKRCLRDQEYELIFDQLLAQRTRAVYESDGAPPDLGGIGDAPPPASIDVERPSRQPKTRLDFMRWFATWRAEIMTLLNRLGFSMMSPDVIVEPLSGNRIVHRIHPRLESQFVFTSVEMVREGDQMKLVIIR